MICSQRLLLRNMFEWSQITILSILESVYLGTILVHTYSDPKDPGSIVESMYSNFIIKNLWKTTMKLYCVHFVNKTPLLSLFCCFDAWSAGQTIGTVYRLDRKTLGTLNPNWHELWKQEKCSSLVPPRGIFMRLNALGRVSKSPDWCQFSPPIS